VRWLIALCVLAATAHAQPIEIGGSADPPVVSVLTFGEGEVLFEKWGHAALCFTYPHRDPVCFNWGVTNFAATDELVWGFLRGEQVFWLEPETKSLMIGYYEVEDRDVWEQTLPLTPDQARHVEQHVLAQLDGPWRFYIYDHFADNCTTRIRDLVDGALGGKLRDDTPYPLTFRAMGYRGLAEHPLLRGLADFLIGRALDAHPTVWQAMFHPDVLRGELYAKLGVKPVLLARRTGPPFPETGPSERWPMLAIAMLFALPLLVRPRRATLIWATVWLAGWGLIIWTLVAISGIPGIRYNEVALVLVPFDLALPVLGDARRARYASWRIVELLAVSALCAIGVLHQPLWIPIISAIVPLYAARSALPARREPARSEPASA
jgi:hypothetical protein